MNVHTNKKAGLITFIDSETGFSLSIPLCFIESVSTKDTLCSIHTVSSGDRHELPAEVYHPLMDVWISYLTGDLERDQ